MGIDLNPFDKSKYVKGNRHTDGVPQPESVIGERIRLWREKILETSEHVFPICGLPGVGKSWLLKYFQDMRYRRIRIQGTYLNLADLKSGMSAETFISDMNRKINAGWTMRGRHILLIDHVPSSSMDERLKKFENDVLYPKFEQGALMIMAQQNPYVWYWERLPHPPPYYLHGFDVSGKRKLFQKLGLSIPKRRDIGAALFSSTLTIPGLAALWDEFKDGEDGEIRAAESYLTYWLEQVVPFDDNDLNEVLRLAGALSWLDSFWDVEGIESILEILGDSNNHLMIRDRLANYQWVTLQDTWVEPVKSLLQVWFRYQYPEFAAQLGQEIGG